MKKQTLKKILIGGLALTGAMGIGWEILMQTLISPRHVVQSWKAPPSQTYDGSQYYFTVIARRKRFFSPQLYWIYVGRDPDFNYGHITEFTFHPRAISRKAIGTSKVKWTRQGVTLTLETQHQLFIPAEQFTGGR
jgi:hypothetical protein